MKDDRLILNEDGFYKAIMAGTGRGVLKPAPTVVCKCCFAAVAATMNQCPKCGSDMAPNAPPTYCSAP